MKAILTYAICCSILSSLLIMKTSSSTVSAPARIEGDSDAASLWEQALAAKGGREKLRGVSNLLESYIDKSHVGLYVFPTKLWDWTDDRPTRLGVYVVMDNLERSLSYRMEGNTAGPPQNLGERHAKEGLWEIYYTQLYYLLETQWLKPRPVQVHSGMI